MTVSALAGKMQFKPGQAILAVQAPPTFVADVQPLPAGATLAVDDAGAAGAGAAGAGAADAVVLFVRNSGELNAALGVALAALKPEGMLWIAYPKGGSGVKSDLTRDAGWEAVFAAGYQPVRQVAVDATWSALRFKAGAPGPGGAALADHFAGARAGLRPIYARVAALALALGGDVTEHVRQSYIGFSRSQQFAVVRVIGPAAGPVTGRSPRLELGLRLPGQAAGGRLQPAGKSFGAQSATHVVELGDADEVDDEVARWLAAAYAVA